METRPRFSTVSPSDYRLETSAAPTPLRARRFEADSNRDALKPFQIEPYSHSGNPVRLQALNAQASRERFNSDSRPFNPDAAPTLRESKTPRQTVHTKVSGATSELKAQTPVQNRDTNRSQEPQAEQQNSTIIDSDPISQGSFATSALNAVPRPDALANETKGTKSDQAQSDQDSEASHPTSDNGLDLLSAGIGVPVLSLLSTTTPTDPSLSVTKDQGVNAVNSESPTAPGITLKASESVPLNPNPADVMAEAGINPAQVQTVAIAEASQLTKASDSLPKDKTSLPSPKGEPLKLGDINANTGTDRLSVLTHTDQTVPSLSQSGAQVSTEKTLTSSGIETKPDHISGPASSEANSAPMAQDFVAPGPNPVGTSLNPAQLQTASAPYAESLKTTPPQASLHLHLSNPDAMAALSAQIHKRLGEKSTDFDIQLHPADLGQVTIRLSIGHDGHLTANLGFDTPAAQAQFKAQADELRRGLEQQGFQLSDAALSFSQNQKGNPQSSGQGSPYQNPSSGRQGEGGFVSGTYISPPVDPLAPARDDDYALLGGRNYRLNLNLVA